MFNKAIKRVVFKPMAKIHFLRRDEIFKIKRKIPKFEL